MCTTSPSRSATPYGRGPRFISGRPGRLGRTAPHRGAARLPASSGFTLPEVLGAVIVIAILLAVALPSVAHALRVRQAEASLKNDLHNAANAYEQAYVEDRVYPELDQLRARGFQLSPNIAVDSQAVGGERVYLRLRHEPTGARCALDYSRSSRAARNRPDCFGGGLPRDTALALRPDDPDPPGADTFTVRPPSGPGNPPNPLALVNPDVSSPGAQSAAPGSTLTQVFVVTNRSPVTRTFRFETGSSDGDVVAAPAAPPPATLAPNVPTAVEVAYTIRSGAGADRSTVIPLRAVDAEDERWSGTGSFPASADLILTAPLVTGPADQVADAGERIEAAWSVTNRSNAARTIELHMESSDQRLVLAPGTVLEPVPMSAGETRQVLTPVLLSAGADGGTRTDLRLRATDAAAPAAAGQAGFTVETRSVVVPPVVEGAADQTWAPGASFTLTWSVRNSSNHPRDLELTLGSAGEELELQGSEGLGSRRAARGETITASATYRVRAASLAGAASVATLVASDAAAGLSASAGTRITTEEDLRDPVMMAIPDPAPWRVDAERTFTFEWTNRSNAPRSFCVLLELGGTGALALLTPNPVCGIPADAGGNAAVIQTLRSAASGTEAVTATVYDEHAPGRRDTLSFVNVVVAARPVAQWTWVQPAYVRRWTAVDASGSYSPTGRPIARYVWDWGDMASLTPETVATASTKHGFDGRGRYYVCLTVIDSEGEASDPACQWIEVITETRARFSFRYRGWFTDISWWSCIDVWWSDQCPPGSHGNARWEINASSSQGDVAIRRVWAQATVYYINTDDADQPKTYTYTGNLGMRYDPARPYEFFQDTDGGGGPSASGRWRVLDTQGGFPGFTPDLHPLVLTTDLGEATGILDSGPHLKPGTIGITVWVEDVNGRVTSASRSFNHGNTSWKGQCHGTEILGTCTGRRYTEVPWQPTGPQVEVTTERQADGTYTVRANASSDDGRVVDIGYNWLVVAVGGQTPEYSRGESGKGDVVRLDVYDCEDVEIAFTAKDDLGRVGYGSALITSDRCLLPPGGIL
jgi:prepilin-type N-terminal cleavage/methylation domain-containing protein